MATGICLTAGSGTPPRHVLASHYYVNSPTLAVISDEDRFDELDIALFIGCDTAYYDDYENGASPSLNDKNLPARVVSQGAEVAIGFPVSIDCTAANMWTEDFYDALINGKTVAEAISCASEQQQTYRTLSESNRCITQVIVYGNASYRLGGKY